MSGSPILQNSVLLAALVAWMLAQIFKLPLHILREGEWDWTMLVRPGGMPSSHSALITAGAHAEIINTILRDLFEGHHLNQEQLREVLGHSPIEALVGLLLGLTVAQILVPLLEGVV